MDWLAFEHPSEGKSTERRHASDLARRDAPTCSPTERLSSVRSRISGSRWEWCVVVDGNRVVQGLLPLNQSTNDDEAWRVMRDNIRSFRPYAELNQVADSMREGEIDRAVVTNADAQLIGMLLRADVEKATMESDDL